MKIYIDGHFYDENTAKISVLDHGFLYGDGVFEGIRVYSRRVFKLKEHIERLYRSAKAILLDIPMAPEQLTATVLECCRRHGVPDCYIRLVVTRGVGTLGLNPESCQRGSVVIIVGSIQLYPKELYETGMEIVTVATSRNLINAINPAIKSLNYLNNILAKIEANIAHVREAIMLNADGYVAECTGDNLFTVHGNRLVTPPLYAGALYGITRGVVMELARTAGMDVVETNLTRYDIFNADECFLTGTAAELMPVVKVDGRVIGTGKPGPTTLKLVSQYHALTTASGEPF